MSVPIFTRTFNNILSPEYSKSDLGEMSRIHKDEKPFIVLNLFPQYPYPTSKADEEIRDYFNNQTNEMAQYLAEEKEKDYDDLNNLMMRYFKGELKAKEEKAKNELAEELEEGSKVKTQVIEEHEENEEEPAAVAGAGAGNEKDAFDALNQYYKELTLKKSEITKRYNKYIKETGLRKEPEWDKTRDLEAYDEMLNYSPNREVYISLKIMDPKTGKPLMEIPKNPIKPTKATRAALKRAAEEKIAQAKKY